MNNSQTSASPLAKRDYFQQVVDQANENRYNWFPLVEYLTFENQPEDVANCVLECYVQLSQYIMKDQENAGYEDLIDSVYSLKLLYDAINSIHQETDTELQVNSPENVRKFLAIIEKQENRITQQAEEIEKLKEEINKLVKKISELLYADGQKKKTDDLNN